MDSAVARASNVLTWKVITYILIAALCVIAIIVTASAVFKSSQVRTATRDRIINNNDTTPINFAEIDNLKVNTLCFDDYPYCTGFDTEGQCIANGGHMCFNDVTVYGNLDFKNGGHFGGQTSFTNFSIGDFVCVKTIDGNVNCSGGTFYPGTLGLTLYFDPDHFASLRRDGQTLVIDSETLRLTGAIVGITRFAGMAFFDERVIFKNQSIINRVGNRLTVLGFNMTEFLDNVLVSGNWTLSGRIIGQNLKFDDLIGIDMYGSVSEITQHDGDLHVCAPSGNAKLCGNTVTIDGPGGIQIVGPITNVVHFVGGIQVDGPMYLSGTQIGENLTVQYLTVMHDLLVNGYTTLKNVLDVRALIKGYQLSITGSSTFTYVTINNVVTVNGASLFNGAVTMNSGIHVGGSVTSYLVSDSTVINGAAGSVNVTARDYTCIGKYNTSSSDLGEYCSMYVPGTNAVDKCVEMPCLRADVVEIATIAFEDANFQTLNVSQRVCLVRYAPDAADWEDSCVLYAANSTDPYVSMRKAVMGDAHIGTMDVASNEIHHGQTQNLGPELHSGSVIFTNAEHHAGSEQHGGAEQHTGAENHTGNIEFLQPGAVQFDRPTNYKSYVSNSPDHWQDVKIGGGDFGNGDSGNWEGDRVFYISGDLYVAGTIFSLNGGRTPSAYGWTSLNPDPTCSFADGYPNYTPCDARIKTNVTNPTPDSSLHTINEIVIHDFEYKTPWDTVRKGIHRGVIAQEVENLVPNAVFHDTVQDLKHVRYDVFVPDLINSVKALSEQNSQLVSALEIMASRLDQLQETVRLLQQEISG
jgi:hypothetical protein